MPPEAKQRRLEVGCDLTLCLRMLISIKMPCLCLSSLGAGFFDGAQTVGIRWLGSAGYSQTLDARVPGLVVTFRRRFSFRTPATACTSFTKVYSMRPFHLTPNVQGVCAAYPSSHGHIAHTKATPWHSQPQVGWATLYRLELSPVHGGANKPPRARTAEKPTQHLFQKHVAKASV